VQRPPEVDRATLLIDAGRAVLRAASEGDPSDLEAALAQLRRVLPDVPGDYDPRLYIAAQRWTYAKTVPDHPHEYLVLSSSTDVTEHFRFADWLNVTGEEDRFMGRTYRYRTVDGHRYWSSPLVRPVQGPNDCILNRRTVAQPSLLDR
jgi:hypothetical protein